MNLDNLDLLLPAPAPAIPSYSWARVASIDPVRVTVDGFSEPIYVTDTLSQPLYVGDRVYIQFKGTRAVIIGKSNSLKWCYGSKGFDKVTLGNNTPKAFTIPASTVPNFVDGYYLIIGRIQFWVKSDNTLLDAEVGTDKFVLSFTSYEDNHSWYVLKPTVHVGHVTREDSFFIRATASSAADAAAYIEWCLIHPD